MSLSDVADLSMSLSDVAVPINGDAEQLGLEINHTQTALTYPELVAQDPGRRVRRPDLITPNPIEAVE